MSDPAWQDLVDVGRLTNWTDSRALGSGPIDDVRRLAGGTQNLLRCLRRSERLYMQRRPPAHPRFDGSATMQREARVLGALADSGVPHAAVIASCDDSSVLGAAFYLMAPVDGFQPSGDLPGRYAQEPAWRHAIGLSMVDGIAALGKVGPAAVGLADFGKLEVWLERQVPRWRKQLDDYREFAGWPGPHTLPGADTLAQWLTQNMPNNMQAGIVHGDFHLGIVMFRHDRPEPAAIVDWELASLGDPLADLGWLLSTWPAADGKAVVGPLDVQPWSGFASARELAKRYAEVSGSDMKSLKWFVVLACFKLGILLEGTHARPRAGKAPPAIGQTLHLSARTLFERGAALVESGDGL